MADFKVSKKVTDQLRDLTEDKEISKGEMHLLLEKVFKKGKGENKKARIMEAAAIAAYHRQTDVPVVDILIADYDALNDRIEKTGTKKDELLLVLKYPWLPLHNNDSELGGKS